MVRHDDSTGPIRSHKRDVAAGLPKDDPAVSGKHAKHLAARDGWEIIRHSQAPRGPDRRYGSFAVPAPGPRREPRR